jgi:hypothetical protein
MSKLRDLIAAGAIPALRRPETVDEKAIKYYFPVLVEEDKEMIAILKDDEEGMYFYIPPFISAGAEEMKVCLSTNLQVTYAHFCVSPANFEMVGIEAYIKPPFSSNQELCIAAIRSALVLCYDLHLHLIGAQLMAAALQAHSDHMMKASLEEVARLRAQIENLVGQPEGI